MKVSLIAVRELGAVEQRQWKALQDGNPVLASPCFSVEYALAAGAARNDVRIAVMQEQGRTVGFFPHQQRWGVGQPAGGRLSDHHGVVCAAGTSWNWAELLRGSRLAYWQFDHLPASQSPAVPLVRGDSPGLDLSSGFDEYQRRTLGTGGRRAKLARMERKLEREVGPLRFEPHDRDPRAFEAVIRMKSEQLRRTGEVDYFDWPWTRTLVERIRDTETPDFGGRVSSLYAGDTLVAAHFGMRSQSVWHWWFPVYSRAHAAYSPGLLLLMKVAEAAALQGHTLVDLGKGDEAYKLRFADSRVPLVEGLVARPSVVTAARAFKKKTAAWIRTSPVAQPLRPLLRGYRSLVDATAARLLAVLPFVGEIAPAQMLALA